MRRTLLTLLAAGLALPLGATDPGTALEAAALAKGSAPGLLRAAKGIVEVPKQAGQCLLLPLGLVETLLSPFPGVELGEGLKHAGKGLVAPFKLCVAALEMPCEIVGGIGDSVGGLAE
jgi:hypothetical protein